MTTDCGSEPTPVREPTHNALLVYPRFPPSYWGFQYAIELMGKRSAMPPLGLITVAAMFPSHYRLRLVDTNVASLTDRDLDWADLVFTSSMVVQRRSLQEVIAHCNRRGKPVVVGGPHPTTFADEIVGASFCLLDEVEEILPRFLADWEAGTAQRVYRPAHKPAIALTPPPRFDLLDLAAYASMALQFSRGCPFDCEFCDITKLFGRVPRTKSNPQVLAELDALYDLGWRGPVFFVDDNFIGNRRDAMRLLPELADWQRQRAYPFDLFTEASVNLAQHEPLMEAMVTAGFSMVFVGIESPNPEALRRTRKPQNVGHDDDDYLLHAVRAIQRKGLEVSAGFILGLDGDGPEVFAAQVAFIQRAGIPRAMVGLLTALRGTDLYARLQAEGRLVGEASGNNVEIALNFRPQLDPQVLIEGYRQVLATLYQPGLQSYFARCLTLVENLGRGARGRRRRFEVGKLLALLRSLRRQLFSRQGPAYLGFLLRTLLRHPRQLPLAIRLAIMGLHFEKLTHQTLAVHDFYAAARTDYTQLAHEADTAPTSSTERQEVLRRHARLALHRLRHLHRRLRPEFRNGLLPNLATAERAFRECVREAPALQLMQRIRPQIQQWFAEPSWRRDLEAHGYALVERWRAGAGTHTLTLAPLLAQIKLRRSFEHFFAELGVRVLTLRDQLAQLGEEGLDSLLQPDPDSGRLLAYLRALGHRAEVVLVPLTESLPEQQVPLQVLAAPEGGTDLPRLICFPIPRDRRLLRNTVIDLGTRVTADPVGVEIAFDRAFALT